jgi:hypothetical protein
VVGKPDKETILYKYAYMAEWKNNTKMDVQENKRVQGCGVNSSGLRLGQQCILESTELNVNVP